MADTRQRSQDLLLRALRFVVALGRRFNGDGCLLRASALTYTTLLSLVPLLALIFAVLKGLGAQRHLEPLLLSRLALDPEVSDRIMTYINRTNVSTLGALGAAALITTVISVLGSIEASFNHIWRVRKGRSLWRKITDYVSTVLLTPFLLLAAVGITSSVQEQSLLRMILNTQYIGDAALEVLRLAPLVINAVALGILYAVMPNRRPHFGAIVVAAAVTGCAWQLVQWTYVTLQIGVARYNAIYGALSQLPVTLVWIYFSWAVVLAGAELAALWEFGADSAASEDREISRWAVALHILVRAAEAFRDGGSVTMPVLVRELRVDHAFVARVVDELSAGGLLAAVEDPAGHYLLARDPKTIDLGLLDSLLDRAAVPPGCDRRVVDVLERLGAERQTDLHRRRLTDLVDHDDTAARG